MTFKRRVLGALGKGTLLQLGRGFELPVKSRMGAEELADALARSKRARLDAIFPALSREELKAACEAAGLPSDGREKQLLQDRLLGAAGGLEEADGGGEPSRAGGAASYEYPTARLAARPEIGVEAQFKQRRAPKTYRYDPSLSPALDFDGQNGARERGEELLSNIQEATTLEGAKKAAAELARLGRPFLNWAGRAERLSFDVPTLPLFVHERLSTKAILETWGAHKRDKQVSMLDLFGDPQRPVADQVLRAYEHADPWVNRMILGDALVVMNSLVEYEGLGEQVQMIYMDPPYGVKFGSNFQPFVRKRDVTHGDDDDLIREPETVQAYRDTWELGLHSYLTYLRDRLLLARELLASSGSIFVQISDENLHHVRELMDEIFDPKNFCSVITYAKTTTTTGDDLSVVNDYLLWYCKDRDLARRRKLFKTKRPGEAGGTGYTKVLLPDGTVQQLAGFPDGLPQGARIFATDNLTSSKPPGDFPVEVGRRTWRPNRGYWKTGPDGMKRLVAAGRVLPGKNTLSYVRFLDDFPCFEVNNIWTDTVGQNQFGAAGKVYAVQTANIAVQRCLLMTTEPGDLVLDPTCGSGTTAFVAEKWGRRSITIDVSRVPLALARQRLLTATFPWYSLRDDAKGPAGGLAYKRRQNKKGEEVGGIVPHVKLESIANEEPPAEEVLVDRPEEVQEITRVSGPFVVEASIPAASRAEEAFDPKSSDSSDSFPDRMLEILRKSPRLQLAGNQAVTFKNVRPPAKSLWLSAEATQVNGEERHVAFVFGPENGAVTERLVREAAMEARAKGYRHLYVVGFAIEPNARLLVEQAEAAMGVPATYVQATPDLLMGDLLKSLRSSQIFSVCGLPDVDLRRIKGGQFEVELLGLDVFDPIKMATDHRKGDDVPAWMLDTDYSGLCFRASQVFFPRTSAWDALRKALKGDYQESVFEHLAGGKSAPFEAGTNQQIAVKVIDDRGNELMVVRPLSEAKGR